MSLSNYPDGMTSRDWDHVYGIARCWECDHEMKEEEYCYECNTCSHCVTGGVSWVEAESEYLCEGCAETKADARLDEMPPAA